MNDQINKWCMVIWVLKRVLTCQEFWMTDFCLHAWLMFRQIIRPFIVCIRLGLPYLTPETGFYMHDGFQSWFIPTPPRKHPKVPVLMETRDVTASDPGSWTTTQIAHNVWADICVLFLFIFLIMEGFRSNSKDLTEWSFLLCSFSLSVAPVVIFS